MEVGCGLESEVRLSAALLTPVAIAFGLLLRYPSFPIAQDPAVAANVAAAAAQPTDTSTPQAGGINTTSTGTSSTISSSSTFLYGGLGLLGLALVFAFMGGD
jgi:hypothetical protein